MDVRFKFRVRSELQLVFRVISNSTDCVMESRVLSLSVLVTIALAISPIADSARL